MELKYDSLAAILKAAEDAGCKLSELVLKDQAAQLERTEEDVYQQMADDYQVMREAVDSGLDPDLRSASGLTGGDAAKMAAYVRSGKNLTGAFIGSAMYRALAVSELNAAMGRIVAAPTAGSCGIVPAAVITMQEEYGSSERDCIMSLFTASAIGMVIGKNASLAGASGGCQAECGSASAMAAGAIVELAGGSPAMIDSAVAIALKNILGLVCDPVAGLVEIPCIKRNAGGVTGAYTAAEIALAGIRSAIPGDEAILAMKKVGDSMPAALKETAEGGLAVTATACRLCQQVFGTEK